MEVTGSGRLQGGSTDSPQQSLLGAEMSTNFTTAERDGNAAEQGRTPPSLCQSPQRLLRMDPAPAPSCRSSSCQEQPWHTKGAAGAEALSSPAQAQLNWLPEPQPEEA